MLTLTFNFCFLYHLFMIINFYHVFILAACLLLTVEKQIKIYGNDYRSSKGN